MREQKSSVDLCAAPAFAIHQCTEGEHTTGEQNE